MDLTRLNFPDVANGTMMVAFMHPKKHFLFNFLICSVIHIALKLVKNFYVGQTYL